MGGRPAPSAPRPVPGARRPGRGGRHSAGAFACGGERARGTGRREAPGHRAPHARLRPREPRADRKEVRVRPDARRRDTAPRAGGRSTPPPGAARRARRPHLHAAVEPLRADDGAAAGRGGVPCRVAGRRRGALRDAGADRDSRPRRLAAPGRRRHRQRRHAPRGRDGWHRARRGDAAPCAPRCGRAAPSRRASEPRARAREGSLPDDGGAGRGRRGRGGGRSMNVEAMSLPDPATVRAFLRAAGASAAVDQLEESYVHAAPDGSLAVLYETPGAAGDALRLTARRMSPRAGQELAEGLNAGRTEIAMAGLRHGAFYAPTLHLLFPVFPVDAALPGLPTAAGAETVTPTLHAVVGVASRGAGTAGVAGEVVGSKPGRRCLFRYTIGWVEADGARRPEVVYGKVLRQKDFERGRDVLLRLRASAGLAFVLPEPRG